jgi:response regulator NasT
MVFQSITYSVLLVSASERINTAVSSLLPPTDYWPVTVARSVSEARRRTLENEYDLIVINSPLPDGSGQQFAMDACADSESGVLLLVRSEVYEEVYYRVLPAGVVTISKPVDAETLSQSVRILCSIRERLRAVRSRQATVEEKMEELRLVNRAKWRLIEQKGMTEDEAHRFLTARAMELRISKKQLAQEILREIPGSGSGLPGGR